MKSEPIHYYSRASRQIIYSIPMYRLSLYGGVLAQNRANCVSSFHL